jgi:hypothetical protein
MGQEGHLMSAIGIASVASTEAESGMKLTSRICYAAAAAILLLGAFLHARAFALKTAAIIDGSGLPAAQNSALKALWLADSTTLATVAVALLVLAARPQAASRPIAVLLALIPAGTTVLIYVFVGQFFAAHLLLAAVVLSLIGTFSAPKTG